MRAGALRITHVADASPVPRLAFAVPRSLGTAVARNRVRRQIRAVLADIAQREPELLGPGDYLVSVGRVGLHTNEVRTWLTSALTELQTKRPTP